MSATVCGECYEVYKESCSSHDIQVQKVPLLLLPCLCVCQGSRNIIAYRWDKGTLVLGLFVTWRVLLVSCSSQTCLITNIIMLILAASYRSFWNLTVLMTILRQNRYSSQWLRNYFLDFWLSKGDIQAKSTFKFHFNIGFHKGRS